MKDSQAGKCQLGLRRQKFDNDDTLYCSENWPVISKTSQVEDAEIKYLRIGLVHSKRENKIPRYKN